MTLAAEPARATSRGQDPPHGCPADLQPKRDLRVADSHSIELSSVVQLQHPVRGRPLGATNLTHSRDPGAHAPQQGLSLKLREVRESAGHDPTNRFGPVEHSSATGSTPNPVDFRRVIGMSPGNSTRPQDARRARRRPRGHGRSSAANRGGAGPVAPEPIFFFSSLRITTFPAAVLVAGLDQGSRRSQAIAGVGGRLLLVDAPRGAPERPQTRRRAIGLGSVLTPRSALAQIERPRAAVVDWPERRPEA